MNDTACRVKSSAMSSSRHRAFCPPLMNPIRLIPFTIVLSCPWLSFILS